MESSDKKYQTYDASLDFNQTKHCFTDNLIVKCLCVILEVKMISSMQSLLLNWFSRD